MKRLEIARALAIRPKILLLDEVMAGLNPADLEKAVKMLRRNRESGVSILHIEHMIQATMALSDRIFVIHEGKDLCSGPAKDGVKTPGVLEASRGKELADA